MVKLHLLELLGVHVAVTVEVEHAEGDLELAPETNSILKLHCRQHILPTNGAIIASRQGRDNKWVDQAVHRPRGIFAVCALYRVRSDN